MNERSDRRLVLLAALVAGLSTACCAVALVFFELVGVAESPGPLPDEYILGTVWPIVGALIVRGQPRNPVGWLMLISASTGPYLVAGLYAATSNGEGALGSLTAWYAVWGFAPPYFFTLPVLPHFFPDGRPMSRRWAKVVTVVIAVATITTLARMASPVQADLAPAVDNPIGVQAMTWAQYVTLVGAISLFVIGIPLAVLSLALRMRRARDLERTQLQWLFLGGLVLAVGAVVQFATWGLALGLVAFPAGIGIAMLRHRLFDVELTLNRTVVFGLLTGFVVLVYVGVVYIADAVAPGSRWGVVLVALAALAAAAGRDRVQALVDRTLFGHRHNPYAVVAHVGRQVAAASQPVDALQQLVDGLRDALRLPYAAFTGGAVAVTSGEPLHGSRLVPVTALGETVGELHVGLRTAGERWSAEQQSAIDEVADRAGTLAYAADLVADIARSRERIVVAREEERRRLRADLHDGVAPALAGTALQLESLARRLEREGQDALAERALGLRDGLRASVSDLRALVHGLRPPVLDQRGLEGALRQLVVGHEVPRCTAEIQPLGAPHAAIEVAAYAIAGEAFGNALRHSVASRIQVSAEQCDGELVVAVSDNGIGMPGRPRAGVGMISMRERAAEVGGRLEIQPTSGGGTTVRATLPLEIP
ncbi:MAG TPA: ATP-binding protein [Nocardioides sp.]|nr:ATP-binding protein [Nocardioides sp.]